MRQEIPTWLAVVIIVIVIAVAFYFLRERMEYSSLPMPPIKGKMQAPRSPKSGPMPPAAAPQGQ